MDGVDVDMIRGWLKLVEAIDPGKLEALATWLDAYDDFSDLNSGTDAEAVSREVQRDLRKWAALVRQLTVEMKEETA